MKEDKNLFPEFVNPLGREVKEKMLKQKGKVVWFTGLSGAGKSTLAVALEKEINKKGYLTEVLDGDKIRKGINNNLGFSAEDRKENIRRIAEVAKLFSDCGVITLCAFISPTIEIRKMAEKVISRNNFFKVFVSTPIEICEQRDIKGLYKKARAGEISDFTGVSAPYESPLDADIEIDTSYCTVQESIRIICDKLIPEIEY
jgi:adenylylsulfate kinase